MRVPRLGRHGGGWAILQDMATLAVLALLVLPGPRGPWAAAVVVAAVGCALAVWAGATLGPALSHLPAPRRGAQRVTRGPYRVLRHPIYVGLVLGAAGASIRAPLAWIPSVVLAVVLVLKARLETELLDRAR